MKLNTDWATSPVLFKLEIESPRPESKYTLNTVHRELDEWVMAAPAENRRAAADAISHCWQTCDEHLNLSGQALTSLPPVVSKLSHVKALNLASNALTAVPHECFALQGLEYFNLSYNPIKHLSGTISKLSGLRHLFLDGVQMSDYPNQMFDLPHECTVYFRDVPLGTMHAQVLKIDMKDHPFGPKIETRPISRLKENYLHDRRSPPPTVHPISPSPETKIIGFEVNEGRAKVMQRVQK